MKEDMMRLFDTIQNYNPKNQQEEYDKEQMLQFMRCNKVVLERSNLSAHFTASMWTINKERTKTLMVHHNLFNSWSWIGGHADGMENLCEVAMKELQEETGVKHAKLVSEEVFSLETLTCNGYMSKGIWVPSHHLVTRIPMCKGQIIDFSNGEHNRLYEFWMKREDKTVDGRDTFDNQN